MTDKTFAAYRDTFRSWQETRSDDLAQAEARIDALLATLFEQSRLLADQDGEIVYFRAIAGSSLVTIERQQREIARLNAAIARLRTDPARHPTRTESVVRALNSLYSHEKE